MCHLKVPLLRLIEYFHVFVLKYIQQAILVSLLRMLGVSAAST